MSALIHRQEPTDLSQAGIFSHPDVLLVTTGSTDAEQCAQWLREEYAVETRVNDIPSVESISEDTEIVVVDRGSVDLDPPAYECQVVVTTDTGSKNQALLHVYDEWLVAPVTKPDLLEVTARLVRRARYRKLLDKRYRVACERARLNAQPNSDNGDHFEEIKELKDYEWELGLQLQDLAWDFDVSDFMSVYQHV